LVRRIVAEGHELGCHGDTHTRFSKLDRVGAERELRESSATLRQAGKVQAFRAPNLDFPTEYLSLLDENGFTVDSSVGRHKRGSLWMKPHRVRSLRRIPASTAPSALRIPPLVGSVCNFLSDPVVLFFHPWEFVDVTREPIPIDCRFRTGQPALDSLRSVIAHYRRGGATFYRMSPLADIICANSSTVP
jgi:hypothetical protein